MLVIPVMLTGSSAYSFEYRNDWQRAWAQFRTAQQPDRLCPAAGLRHRSAAAQRRPDPAARPRLVADAARPIWRRRHRRRRGRAAPALSRAARRSASSPPATGRTTSSSAASRLRAANSAAIPRMLDEGVRRLDLLYAPGARRSGLLRPDPTLVIVAAAAAAGARGGGARSRSRRARTGRRSPAGAATTLQRPGRDARRRRGRSRPSSRSAGSTASPRRSPPASRSAAPR